MTDLKAGVPIVRALERGLSLLQAFSVAAPRQSLSQLARVTALDAGTTRRLLQTLMVQGFVGYSETTSQYFLATKVLELGAAVQTDHGLKEVGARYLHDLAQRTRATAFLWLYSDGMALCIDRVRASIPNVDATWFAVGARTSLNAGGGPRVLLAHLSNQERAIALSQQMISRTPASQTDPETLSKLADAAKQRGWDLAVDDFVVGLAGLGVPIFSPDGELAGAISLSTLTSAFGNPTRPTHLSALQAAAAEIGRQLETSVR
jgi:DNA-binding IclR family transcriptional regulator